jgi:cell division septal protein FtsQ
VTRRRTGRRSQRRLGTQYHTSAKHVRLSLTPAVNRWQGLGSRFITTLLLVILGWAIYAVFDSPNFYVFAAEIQGNTAITPNEIYAVSDIEGMSAFWINPHDVEARIESLAGIKSAQVKIRLPARVIIKVEERSPELIWQTGDARWWIDAEGTVVPPRGDLPGALTIIDSDAQPVAPGQQLDPQILAATHSLHRLLPELPVMNYSRSTGLSFTTAEGWPVYLGDGKNMDAKLTILVALRKELLAKGVSPQFIDVRFVERPFYK